MTDLDRGDMEHFTLPGHDRGCAEAILAQARNGYTPLSDIQVLHLLRIGYSAGLRADRSCPLCGAVHGDTAAAWVAESGREACYRLAKAHARYDRAKARDLRKALGRRWWQR